jgi:hypothetical protein
VNDDPAIYCHVRDRISKRSIGITSVVPVKVVEKRGSEHQFPPESVITFDRNAQLSSPSPAGRSFMSRYTSPASVRKAVSLIPIAMNSAQERSERLTSASSACLSGKGLSGAGTDGHITRNMSSPPVANHGRVYGSVRIMLP